MIIRTPGRDATMPLVRLASPLLLLAIACSAPPSAAETLSCSALRDQVLEAAHVTSTRVVPASDDLPAYCQARVTALPEISIEVRLPLEGWNGMYYQVGCGGFCGVLGRADATPGGFINAMGPGLRKGYATATSDSGHHGLDILDAQWAYHDPQAERDWGWRSIGETHRVASALVAAYYGDSAKRSIFQGCSTGGRMAHMATLRYPDLFQGIISGAPAMDYTGLVALSMAHVTQANTDERGHPILQPGKEMLVGDEVLRQCDSIDGQRDGLIEDPRRCDTNLSVLLCGNGGDQDQCLTEAELAVIEQWRRGPVNRAGESLFPGGIPEGSESFWWLWLTGKADGGGRLVPAFTQNFGAYMAFAHDPGPGYSALDFDFERDPPRLETMAAVYNADDPNISSFLATGGKMIVWHGWADAIVPPFKTVQWYQQAQEIVGADVLANSVRLYMIPGMDHCGILPGPGGIDQSRIDPLGALEQWLDSGTPPTSLTTPSKTPGAG